MAPPNKLDVVVEAGAAAEVGVDAVGAAVVAVCAPKREEAGLAASVAGFAPPNRALAVPVAAGAAAGAVVSALAVGFAPKRPPAAGAAVVAGTVAVVAPAPPLPKRPPELGGAAAVVGVDVAAAGLAPLSIIVQNKQAFLAAEKCNRDSTKLAISCWND